MSWFSLFKKRRTILVSAEEFKLTQLAEAEARGTSLLDTSSGDNMPPTSGSVLISKKGGLGMKPIAVEGTLLSRTIDDINARVAENDIRAKRSR